MENQVKTNLLYVDLLNEWDPFQLKDGSYDTEIADTIQAVYELDNPVDLAERIQEIFGFSFDATIPMEQCLKVAEELLLIKENDACSI
jgi:hypothetical protein